jgi:hypothetical protein
LYLCLFSCIFLRFRLPVLSAVFNLCCKFVTHSQYQHINFTCYTLSRSFKNCSIRTGRYITYHLLQYNTEHRCRQCITLSQACLCQMLQSVDLRFSLFRFNFATSFLLSSLISFGTTKYFSISCTYVLFV